MELIILSGLSGAGKTSAAKYLEDMGFFCIDNVPPHFLQILVKTLKESPPEATGARYCFVTDVRSVQGTLGLFHDFGKILDYFSNLRLIFLEATDETLLSRYKQTRRNHPLASGSNLLSAIQKERTLLAPVRERATDIIDTTSFTGLDLRDALFAILQNQDSQRFPVLYLQSFGYKYGLPLDSDIIFDLRFMPNPYYLSDLRHLSGLDDPVKEYVFSFPESREYFERVVSDLQFLLPFYRREGKVRLNIAIGCTGGHHRSVAFVESLARLLREKGRALYVEHRDLKLDPVGDH